MENEYEKLLSWLKANSYLEEGVAKIKCSQCRQAKLRMSKCRHEEPFGLIEFAVKCDNCTNIQGYWAYGEWLDMDHKQWYFNNI